MSKESVLAVGGTDVTGELKLVKIERRSVGPNDVHIHIKHCGMCHSDLHTVRQEWGPTPFPVVPGHEIVGIVDAVGDKVTKFKVGQTVGVGCFVDSCRECNNCKVLKEEQYCGSCVYTYNTPRPDGTHTIGGYTTAIVVDENYVLNIPANLDLAAAAPLLCAGITMYSPMKHFGLKAGMNVAVNGLGGLGHMAVKLAAAMGAHVTVLTRTAAKSATALRLGAEKVLITSDKDAVAAAAGTFDMLFDTVSAVHSLDELSSLMSLDGTIVLVAVPPGALPLSAGSLIFKRVRLAGSLIGGIKETQEMLDFCGAHNIVSDIELVNADYANIAYERILASDVQFRFVLDIENTLKEGIVVKPLPEKK